MSTKTLFYTEGHERATVEEGWQKQKDALQHVINLYDATGLPKLEKTAPAKNASPCGDLYRLLNDTDNFLFDKITGGSDAKLTIGNGNDVTHIPIEKSHAFTMLKKPDGHNALIAAIRGLQQSCVKGYAQSVEHGLTPKYSMQHVEAYFFIDGEGYAAFTEKTVAAINEAGKHYVQSEGGKKIYDFVQATVKAYYENGVDKVRYTGKGTIGELVMEVVQSMDDDNKTFVVNKDFVRLDNNLNNQGI